MKNTKGFTLVEILIIVSLIGILASVSIPMFNRMYQNAVDTKVEVELFSINTAIAMYYGANNMFPSHIKDLEGYVNISNIEQKYTLNPNLGG